MEQVKIIGYPFAWLDEIVEITLNTNGLLFKEWDHQEIVTFELAFHNELKKVYLNLKGEAFERYSLKKISTVVLQYYSAVELLERQARSNLSNYPKDTWLCALGIMMVEDIVDLKKKIEIRYADYLPSPMAEPKRPVDEPGYSIPKILCKLSVDQLGIILKAADDTKVIIAKSLSVVFKTITPFLSTDKKVELSWDSMRSNSYHPEDGDKLAAIQALENLIRKIKEY